MFLLNLLSSFSAAYSLYLFSYSQHGSVYSGLYSYSLGQSSWIFVVIYASVSVEFDYFKGGYCSFFFGGGGRFRFMKNLNSLNETIGLWCRWYSFYFRLKCLSICFIRFASFFISFSLILFFCGVYFIISNLVYFMDWNIITLNCRLVVISIKTGKKPRSIANKAASL